MCRSVVESATPERIAFICVHVYATVGPMRYALILALACALSACDKQETSTLRTLERGTVSDESGQAEVNIGYQPRKDGELELVVKLSALGTEEMDKLVVEVAVDGFVVSEGEITWTGFVPPRQPQTHRVVLQAREGESYPTARVTVSRSHDSFVLMHRELSFEKTDAGLKPTS